MDNNTWIATIAGIALGIGIVLAIIYVKQSQTTALQTASKPVIIEYDDQGRPIKLREIG